MSSEKLESPDDNNKDAFEKARQLNDALLMKGGAKLEATPDQIDDARSQMRADMESRGLDPRSPDEKWNVDIFRELGKDEAVTVPLDRYDPARYDTSHLPEWAPGHHDLDLEMQTYDGAEVHGITVKSLSLGVRKQHAYLHVLDISRRPVIGTEDGRPIHSVGHGSNGEPIELAGDYALMVRTTDLDAFDIKSLEPGEMTQVGRADGNFGADVPDLLPLTVSRDHLAIGLTEDGKVRIENHNPTYDTVVVDVRPKEGDQERQAA